MSVTAGWYGKRPHHGEFLAGGDASMQPILRAAVAAAAPLVTPRLDHVPQSLPPVFSVVRTGGGWRALVTWHSLDAVGRWWPFSIWCTPAEANADIAQAIAGGAVLIGAALQMEPEALILDGAAQLAQRIAPTARDGAALIQALHATPAHLAWQALGADEPERLRTWSAIVAGADPICCSAANDIVTASCWMIAADRLHARRGQRMLVAAVELAGNNRQLVAGSAGDPLHLAASWWPRVVPYHDRTPAFSHYATSWANEGWTQADLIARVSTDAR